MLILHAAQDKGNLVLWSEDSEPRLTSADRQLDGKHPYSAEAQRIAEAIGLEMGDNCFGSAIAWLPSRGDAPVPSSPMAGPMPKSRAKPRIRPWTVPTLRLAPEQAVQLLRKWYGQQVVKPGVAIGTDLAYWTHALQLAVSLTARQQFLPSLSERGGKTVAAWIPVFIGEDAHRLAELAGLMPASARALTSAEATEPPATRGPGGPQGVHNSPGRPPGTRRNGYRTRGATAVRLRPRRLAVRPVPVQSGGTEQPGTAPATPPPGR